MLAQYRDELGIPWIDPTECMRGNAAEVFLPQDQHPTAAGHVCLADALLDRVDAWLPDLRGARGAR